MTESNNESPRRGVPWYRLYWVVYGMVFLLCWLLNLQFERLGEPTWSEDGRYVSATNTRGKMYVWEVATERKISTKSQKELNISFDLKDMENGRDSQGCLRSYVKISPDRRWRAELGTDDSALRIFDTTREREPIVLSNDSRTVLVSRFEWLPDSRSMIVGLYSKIVKYEIDMEAGTFIEKWTFCPDVSDEDVFMGKFVLLKDGTRVLVNTYGGGMFVCDTASGEQICRLPTVSRFCSGDFCVSPDGKTCAYENSGYPIPRSRSKRVMQLWNLETGEKIRTFPVPLRGFPSWSWSPDGKYLVAWGSDGTLRLWNPETGEQERRMSIGKFPFID